MTLSYNWLSSYLPEKIDPATLSAYLTSIGLEVESLERYEEVPGGLSGLVVGEVLTCEQHPDADKLKLTTVAIGNDQPLSIVCGAANVAAGQKVIVAPVGTTIYPVTGEPITLKKAKIRGQESAGMICAEDEIGLGTNHDGILVLPAETVPGTPVKDLFHPYEDFIYEIGLTPNRMDAMSHLGVARDLCAYLSHHQQKTVDIVSPLLNQEPLPATGDHGFTVSIQNPEACQRYSGIVIKHIRVQASPLWMQAKLKAIGVKPINNVVDITNYILHETGQPLHAFDADRISGNQISVGHYPAGTVFRSLDDKERKLLATDLMIGDANGPMCMAGVYGGKDSGVSEGTTTIFLESACFNGTFVRRSSLAHQLRTDAAVRFEKGTDVNQTIPVLNRAARLMAELGAGTVTGPLIDVYPSPVVPVTVTLTRRYLLQLSGKAYEPADVTRILSRLGFTIISNTEDGWTMQVPSYKTDIHLPADIVEEIMRIDGLDNIAIPASIRVSPSVETDHFTQQRKEKMAEYLVGLGFHEIFTNSISNSKWYDDETLKQSVRMINSLSADLDLMRPNMLPGGLQAIAYNQNRQNDNACFFEYGKTYHQLSAHQFQEVQHLAVYASGIYGTAHWKRQPIPVDYFLMKGIADKLLHRCGITGFRYQAEKDADLSVATHIWQGETYLGKFGQVQPAWQKRFDIKAPVFYIDLQLDNLLQLAQNKLTYREISKFPAVNRDLALVVDKNVSYSSLEQVALAAKIRQLQSVTLFDVFESDKLGAGKKSMAVNFVFLDESKTLTDQEIDGFMQKIIKACEKEIQAEIRK